LDALRLGESPRTFWESPSLLTWLERALKRGEDLNLIDFLLKFVGSHLGWSQKGKGDPKMVIDRRSYRHVAEGWDVRPSFPAEGCS
jgi:hypothetical protein